jgi:hypothetical protein
MLPVAEVALGDHAPVQEQHVSMARVATDALVDRAHAIRFALEHLEERAALIEQNAGDLDGGVALARFP